MFKTNTDWTRNKKSAAIIYTDASGEISEITLARFLADSPENTVEMFNKIKEVSDLLFYDWDREERTQATNETQIKYETREFATPSIEDDVFDSEYEAEEEFLKRKEKMTTLAPQILDRLTPTQRRRYLLHYEDGLTVRRIADIDGTSHVAVIHSLGLAQRKIDKSLKNQQL